ncbi:MAG: hypothetical protein IPI53_06455 [Saprospiraceae bacterium]|nr:hypothetical protein [Saprospiraceae bacterium]
MKRLILIWLCILFFGGFDSKGQSCESTNLVHYQYNDIKNILEKNSCLNCHHGINNGWSFDTYRNMFSSGKCGSVIKPGSPATSILVDRLNGGAVDCGNPIPLAAHTIPSKDLLAIETWILVGAPEFCIPEYEEVKNIFNSNQCQDCHNKNGEWSYNTYNSLFFKPGNSVCSDPLVVPFEHNNSFLYKKISGQSDICGQKMLAGNVPMSYEDVARVRDWINSGAFQASRALPVVLTDFSAYNEEDKKVVLYWQTSSEYNTAFFEIENSGDGIQFNTIGKKQASSNPNVLTNYEFTDLTPGFGNQYYRLKMTDHDGLVSYSSTRAVRLKSNVETLKIYPSSLQNNDPLFIEWIASDNSEIAKIQILDIIGRLVFTTIINPGINQTTIPALNPGLYYAVIPHDIENYFVKKMIMIH